jgi:hypothetical protein
VNDPSVPGSRPSDRDVADASFDDLVTAATVGLSRKPLAVTGLEGPAADQAGALDSADPAAALLEAAALMTVARRAGFQPEPGLAGPPPSPAEAAPELSPRAERALRQLGGAQLAPGFAAGDKELLAELLTAAGAAGYVASAPLLPDLLDAAVRTVALRAPVTAMLGARGRWLAAQRPDWQRVVAALTMAPRTPDPAGTGPAVRGPAATGPTATSPAAAGRSVTGPSVTGPSVTGRAATGSAATTGDDPEVWRTGTRAARHAYAADRRDRDPNAGRELLAADWARLPGDERAALLPLLARGLSAADEDFLDAALDDRVAAVRGVARRLLTRLPASRFAQRATERATAVLRLERDGPRQRLTALPPGDPDQAAVRDGIDARPPTPAIGVGPWLLTQLIAAVPVDRWTALFDLPPQDIARLPVEPNVGLDLRAGWRLAAVSQGSGGWAEALLAVGDPDDGGRRPPAAWPPDERLAALLSPSQRAARVAALLAGASLNAGPAAASQVLAEVGGGPVPWPEPLAGAVLAVLGRAAPLTVLPRLPRGLLDLAARGLPATGGRDYAAELTRLADARPQTWTPLVRKTAETIQLRRAFLEEIR